jgi:hypothetical protein
MGSIINSWNHWRRSFVEMGIAGMNNQVSQWAKQPYLNTLLDLLLDKGFTNNV